MHLIKVSNSWYREYDTLCKNVGRRTRAPILDVNTRWNSTYAMLYRALQMQEVSLILATLKRSSLNSNLCIHLTFIVDQDPQYALWET
jgi:hypothetical protein